MQRLEVSGAVRPIYGSLGVKQLKSTTPSCMKKQGGTGIHVAIPTSDTIKNRVWEVSLHLVCTFLYTKI